uniref:Uncharacterized protein n=1 Tax=Siphoviridae sp. ctsxw88 TaxID=2825701 RepID=A0A8S5PHF7_9CAUD|nr:MAG TPA: hypothetical protein [Siphoviridae sp. ctsxw88]
MQECLTISVLIMVMPLAKTNFENGNELPSTPVIAYNVRVTKGALFLRYTHRGIGIIKGIL